MSKLLKSKDTKGSSRMSKAQASSMTILLAKMQADADQVEKDVLWSEEKLKVDQENDKNDREFQYQDQINAKLGDAEGLLRDLFLDIDKLKKLKHPQAADIEKDIIALHTRWSDDTSVYVNLYEQIDDVQRMPRIDWAPVFNQKQKALSKDVYGNTTADLEKQIAAQNILEKELEAYSSQLCVASAGSKEKHSEFKKQYNSMLEKSKLRRQHLNSLYDYTQGCDKELQFLSEEQDKIKKQDWSDHMVDPPDVRRQYEHFKNNSLLAHESKVNDLQDDCERLLELKHPASNTIEAQRDAVRNEWQKFLNLCICKETHLDNMEEYTKYQMDCDQLSETLSQLSSSVDPKSVSKKSNAETLMQLQVRQLKQANASLNLENQIKKVDGLVSGFERNLSVDGPIPDLPNAIQARTQDIQSQQRSVAAAQKDMMKLEQDLQTTEKLCNTLQQDYQEYCPDIQRQRKDVKQLQSRYANVANQLKERENVLQEASAKHQDFQNTCQSMNSFLDNLPKNQIKPSDDLSEVSAKKNSQQRVVDDLKRREEDIDRVAGLSHDLQNLLNDYEADVDKFNGTLEAAGTPVPKKPQMLTLSDSIDKEEKNLAMRYAEAKSENIQRQKQMDLAQTFHLQNEEKVQMVAQKQVQQENQQKSAFELDSLVKELEEEKERTTHAQTELKTFKSRMMSLKSRRGVERVEEKEVLQYYRDPKLEADLAELRDILDKEAMKRSSTQTEVEIINERIVSLEDTIKNNPPKLLTREVTEFEKDPQLDVEAAKIRDEIARMRDEIRVRDGEQIQMKTEVSILQQKRPPIKERVVKKEVVKVEQDPQMVKSLRIFETEISDESKKCTLLNDEIFQTRSQINALERMIPNIQPKVITKEVKKIEQDPDLITESTKLRTTLEEERIENSSLSQEVMDLQRRYREVQALKPRVEIKEIINELYRIDPNTEVEIMRLRKEIQDTNKQRADIEKETRQVNTDLNALYSEKPKVEVKEVLQEVVKEERSPENEREIARLNDQVNRLDSQCTTLEDQVRQLRRERDEWKAEKSKIETQLVNKEVIKYEPDPLQEKEAERLRKKLREEAQLRRDTEEMVFDLQNKYLMLERQKPEEKVVVQEVVRLQKDPKLAMEHDRLSRNLDDEVMSRRQLDLELQQLRTRLEDKERILRESDEHQKRIQAESELKEIRLRITQLENAPPPVEESIVVEEVLKVERDPKLERMTGGVRSDMDQESREILRLQREIRKITMRLEILQKEKSGEKTVYKEVVRVEKDQAVEAERDHLREQVSQNKFARQDMEDEIRRLNDKINALMSSQSNVSRDETSMRMKKEALLRDNDDLTREFRTLEAKKRDTSMSFQQQSRLMSEKTQKSRQRSVKMESDVQRLERQILEEKDNIHQRDSIIRDLLMYIHREDDTETRTKETNVSTKVTVLDPDTGKEISPYDAYLGGMIDRQQYIHLQELECDWEEVTSTGPDGETSVLQDRTSGKQYPIKDAIKEGRLTEYDLQQYRKGELPISEFALLVAGDKNKQSKSNSVTKKPNSSVKSLPLDINSANETQPIAGIMDTQTDTCCTIRNATWRKLIEPMSAQRLLEAQAATGGITDISNGERYKVNKALQRGLIEDSQVQRLLNAEKAFTGVQDPVTKECLSVGNAVQRGWTPKDTAIRHLEAQHLTGGLVDPATGRRVSLMDAIGSGMIDNAIARDLQNESAYVKDIVDPITKEKINYKQALDRCKNDPTTGLPMLPASSKVSEYNSSKYARF
ncbi:PREDICTED: envoplakin-like [Cyprinodon variegatus]|uniref:envoplakin-like n=1 Tax=Cyprinodon variegatus TaxID=28743 RepID=UPI0007428255|nr:PREDICTED: envoplakin-like [Cyprinodon variegatus]